MELSGEEQKLQALFSELRTADELTAPRFAVSWNRAQLQPRRARTLNRAFVGAAALILCALVSLAVWSRYARRTVEQSAVVKNAPAATAVENLSSGPSTTPELMPSVKPSLKPRETSVASHADNSKTRRKMQLAATNRKLTQDAKTISDWQSPTSALLSSPTEELFSSLPQLSESATELKSFLPSRPN